MTEKVDHLLKFLIIGDTAVGKTSILLRYTDGTYTDEFITTVGVDFKVKKMEQNGKKLKIQIVCLAGQEKFHTITQSYYRGSHGVIVVYDCTDVRTFDNCKGWLEETAKETANSAVRLLVGNKCDMPKQVPTEKGASFAKAQGVYFMEISAKSGMYVNEAFQLVIDEVLKKMCGDVKTGGAQQVEIGRKEQDKKKKACYLI
ncbi:hypothetical protein EIN_344150 [Entamoeba invadens IP1]|uniref:Uncharacterized protein n=1 Tax=Entamoeba invadens IP1 TaxID=370355 RepID=A0A0A1U6J3_ENTIV|nr:hypothetical protein EIN_344150 [Entamoeba invadens IP1]ELP88485.1 hypothetical protein EIN_344150 [Entamoeba invadens IP1]|eukprot:XP_004255256.1 hypothetical protein EIN_344150 [Entamoeba invadens IP1]